MEMETETGTDTEREYQVEWGGSGEDLGIVARCKRIWLKYIVWKIKKKYFKYYSFGLFKKYNFIQSVKSKNYSFVVWVICKRANMIRALTHVKRFVHRYLWPKSWTECMTPAYSSHLHFLRPSSDILCYSHFKSFHFSLTSNPLLYLCNQKM